MTINKDAWAKIAKKYNTKAKWADALLMLNVDDHDDLLSALIELDPKDLDNYIYVNDEHEALEKADEALSVANSVLEEVRLHNSNIQSDLEHLKSAHKDSGSSLADFILNFPSDKLPDPKDLLKILNDELNRGPKTS